MQEIVTILADDHCVVRKGIQQILSPHFPSMRFVECATSVEIFAAIKRAKPQLIILDVSMPDTIGLEVLTTLKTNHPHIPVIVFTGLFTRARAILALRLGAVAFLSKATDQDELARAAQEALKGRRYLSPNLSELLIDSAVERGNADPAATLSEREHDILVMIARGQALKEIASRLSLSPKTVSTYRARILRKLKLDSNASLIQFALKTGLID